MKKAYVKPSLAVEFYELTQTIAACETKIGFMDSQCVADDPDSTEPMKNLAYANWFVSGACVNSAEGMDGNDSICYHTNANAAFTS